MRYNDVSCPSPPCTIGVDLRGQLEAAAVMEGAPEHLAKRLT